MATTAKKKLGKGLSALISGEDLETSLASGAKNKNKSLAAQLVQLAISDIQPNPDQPRQVFEEDKLTELAQSIKQVGLIEPVVVSKKGEKFYLIAGERRLRAAHIAGFTSIPALVKNDRKDNILEMMLIENIQRQDLSR